MDTMTYAFAAEVTRTVANLRHNRRRRFREVQFTPLDLSLLRPQARLGTEEASLKNQILRRVLWEARFRRLPPAFGYRP